MSSIPSSMKSWIVAKSGEPKDALKLKTDWPTPEPPRGDGILISVSHASINPLDLVLMGMPTDSKKNTIPAVDFVGEILDLGPSVSLAEPELRVGVTVSGTVPVDLIFQGHGTLSEYIVVPAHSVAEKPSGLENGAATALMGVAGQTTAILVRAAEVAQGETVLVNGASGGVGTFLVQVLRAKGVRVIAICSGRNEALVRRLGADEVVDYTAHDSLYDHLTTKFGDASFDAIFDCIGDNTLYQRCPAYLKPQGKYLCIVPSKIKVPETPDVSSRTYLQVDNSPAGTGAKEAAGFYKSGWVKEIPIDSMFDFEDAVKAFEKLASKRAQGKIVVKVRA